MRTTHLGSPKLELSSLTQNSGPYTMKNCLYKLLLCGFALVLFGSKSLTAQTYQLLLKGGHVIDPKNGINEPMDVAITGGRIATVAHDIPAAEAERVVDVRGLYVTPGIIDLHTHVFFGTDPHSDQMNGYRSVKPDNFSFKYGITTMVDAGCAGWRNFELFKEQTIAHSRTRVLAFLRIVGEGARGGVYSQNIDDMDPKMAALTALQHPEIVGFKIAHYDGHDWEPIHRLVEAGEQAGLPVMVDFGSADPPLPLETLFMEKLRPGDIYTHMYGGGGSGREAILDEHGRIRSFVPEARRRGIVFDVGHGSGSLYFAHAIPAIQQGLKPTTISSDLHQRSANSSMQNMLNVMSKMLNIGMTLEEVIEASTWQPARVISRDDLGHLSEGAIADVTVLNVLKGEFGYVDVDQPPVKVMGDRKLEAELTVFGGEIVWDLNGRSYDLIKN